MARSLGIPARVVEGFVPGTFDTKLSDWVVRGTDTHMWAQVYFPGYGWVNFEPSTGYSSFTRPAKPLNGDTNDKPPPVKPTGKVTQTPTAGKTPTPTPALLPPTGPEGPGPAGVVALSFSTLLALALLTALAALAWWRLIYRGLSPISQKYARMAFLGHLAGVPARPDQTASEYSATLADRVPEQREAIADITELYQRERWSNSPPQEPHILEERWRGLRDTLVRRVRVRPPHWLSRWRRG
jgi:hypothetical protein